MLRSEKNNKYAVYIINEIFEQLFDEYFTSTGGKIEILDLKSVADLKFREDHIPSEEQKNAGMAALKEWNTTTAGRYHKWFNSFRK